MIAPPWPHLVGLGKARRGASLHLVADAEARARIAEALDIEALDGLEADVELSAWLDGVEISAAWRAAIVQICGVSLDPFDTGLTGRFTVRVVPAGSANAPAEPAGELVVDLEAEDPPDVLDGESLDVGDYVVEHLALAGDRSPSRASRASSSRAPPEPKPAVALRDVLKALKRD